MLQSGKTFASEADAFHYARKVVFNTTIDFYRRYSRQDSFLRRLAVPMGNHSNPLQALLDQELETKQRSLLQELRRALEKLPYAQREAVSLIFGRNGKKLKDICSERGIPYSTLRSRMLAAVENIRRELRDTGAISNGSRRNQD